MDKVFDNPSQLEALVKQKFGFPDFIMMENAALAIKNLITELSVNCKKSNTSCIILCGKGNNGGDGYALARLLQGEYNPLVFCLEPPAANEAKTQYEMCRKLGITFLSKTNLIKKLTDKSEPAAFIVDCLYGTGFKGELTGDTAKIIELANKAKSIRIACDIPTALAFNADYTVTMGEHKLPLFSDKAKNVTGKIIVAPLGIDRMLFENTVPSPAAYLITKQDCKLPLRTNKAAHKGTYGHTAVFAGEKSGAAIISATAAMNFGSGLTTIIKQESDNLSQFKISPELMISDSIPPKTTCIVLGPGCSKLHSDTASLIQQWWFNEKTKSPAAVFDAGMFGDPDFEKLLKKLNTRKDSRIVLTPHLAELARLCNVETLAYSPETKILIGKTLTKKFPKTTLVIKSANTFICSGGQTFIVTDGSPSLAKGGSGDVLAGMIASLLAQGYSAKDAAITACEVHALAGTAHGAQAYDLSPMRIIEIINSIK